MSSPRANRKLANPIGGAATGIAVASGELPSKPALRPVRVAVYEQPAKLEAARSPAVAGLRYLEELKALWEEGGDPERFVYRAVLAVGLAIVDERVAGWGQLLAARPLAGEAGRYLAFCRVSRLDVAPAFRRRRFADARSGAPISVVLLRALLAAAPYDAAIVAEVTPDAETLFEEVGFKMQPSGRWLYCS